MEKYNFENQNNSEKLKKKFDYYLKDFPLTSEDLQKSFLDVGTGTGEFIQYLREELGNKQAVGVDNQEHKINGKEGFIVADGLNLPFKDESFDVVTAHNYLPMFVDDPIEMKTVINELIRVTKKGGKIMGDITTPESEYKSNLEVKINLGEEYSEKNHERYIKQYEGAESLQNFIDKLKDDYNVQIINPKSDKTVIIIEKIN